MHKPPLTFARFVGLPENRAALLAVQEVARQLASAGRIDAHNPLFLHGPPGTGKSHLVQALLEQVTRQRPGIVAAQFAAGDLGQRGNPPEALQHALVTPQTAAAAVNGAGFPLEAPHAEDSQAEDTAADASATDSLAAAADADLVIVEDLQHLPPPVMTPLAGWIDDLLARGQQMVFTANTGPQQLAGRHGKFPARLVNRLSGGIVVRLEPPQFDSRRILLQVFAQHLDLEADVLDWLAGHVTEGARQLAGAVSQLEALRRLHGTLDLETVRRHFHVQAEASAVTVEKIAERVGGYFRVEPKLLASKQRHRQLLLARQVSMYLARRLTGLSLEQIGAYFGGRDHTTVLHACRKVEEALASDAALSGAVRQLQADLG